MLKKKAQNWPQEKATRGKFTQATSWQNQQNDMCSYQRLRSPWASAQSDQSLLSAWRKWGSLATHWWVFARRTVILLVLSWGGWYWVLPLCLWSISKNFRRTILGKLCRSRSDWRSNLMRVYTVCCSVNIFVALLYGKTTDNYGNFSGVRIFLFLR